MPVIRLFKFALAVNLDRQLFKSLIRQGNGVFKSADLTCSFAVLIDIYNDSETGKPVRCEAVSGIEFRYYFDIWDNYHYFGLPQGSGWGGERQWLLNFLKQMEKTFKHVENFLIEKQQRKAEARAQNG